MLLNFPYTTREVADLAGTTQAAIQRQNQRNGHWRGVMPRTGRHGRLLWPRADVLAALGVMPTAGDMQVSEQLALGVLTGEGVPLAPESYRTIETLLDLNRTMADPEGELWLCSEILEAWLNRAQRQGIDPEGWTALAALQAVVAGVADLVGGAK